MAAIGIEPIPVLHRCLFCTCPAIRPNNQVAGGGFEPTVLKVMSLASYQTAPSRDSIFDKKTSNYDSKEDRGKTDTGVVRVGLEPTSALCISTAQPIELSLNCIKVL